MCRYAAASEYGLDVNSVNLEGTYYLAKGKAVLSAGLHKLHPLDLTTHSA